MANYDADFSGPEPYIINIWTKEKGYEFGYIVFHDFLRRVGLGNTFVTTDFTDGGSILIQKAVSAGMIEKEEMPENLQNITRWKVVCNPMDNLKKIVESYS